MLILPFPCHLFLPWQCLCTCTLLHQSQPSKMSVIPRQVLCSGGSLHLLMSCWAQSSGCLSPRILAVLPGRAASLQHLDQAQPTGQGQHPPPLQQSQVVTGAHLPRQGVMSELCVSQIPGSGCATSCSPCSLLPFVFLALIDLAWCGK